MKQQRKFYDTPLAEKKRNKDRIREQRQEKEDEYDRFMDDL